MGSYDTGGLWPGSGTEDVASKWGLEFSFIDGLGERGKLKLVV